LYPNNMGGEVIRFCDALKCGDAASAQEMLTAAAPEDAIAWSSGPLDDQGRTALHYVLEGPQASHLRLTRFLCQQRADVNSAGPDGITPLHLGAKNGSKYVVRALLCARADNLKETTDGRSTVDFAQNNVLAADIFEEVGYPDTGPTSEVLRPASQRAPARKWEEEKAKSIANAVAERAKSGYNTAEVTEEEQAAKAARLKEMEQKWAEGKSIALANALAARNKSSDNAAERTDEEQAAKAAKRKEIEAKVAAAQDLRRRAEDTKKVEAEDTEKGDSAGT